MGFAGEPNQEKAVKLKNDLVLDLVELHAPAFIVEEVAKPILRATKPRKALARRRQRSSKRIKRHENNTTRIRLSSNSSKSRNSLQTQQ
jgi:hypothetical protein